jgi:chromosome segregation ATPase
MKTIEELEAELKTVTRERDRSLFAWESAGMQGRTAQSAMLELARQLEEHREKRSMYAAECVSLRARLVDAQRERDEARETILALTTAKAEADLEIAILTTALDERDAEAERSLEQYDRLVHQLADATNESTHFQVMCKRETEEVERLARQVELLTDERDELLVRVANQDAELRATREAYNDARAELTRVRCAEIGAD